MDRLLGSSKNKNHIWIISEGADIFRIKQNN